MKDDKTGLVAEAIEWHLRQSEMRDDDWQQFIAWLEQSAAHAAAYNKVAARDRLITAVPLTLAAANDDAPPRLAWKWALGGSALAAVGTAVLMMMPASNASPYQVTTRAGQRQTLTLSDGTSVELNGETRLRLDHSNSRVVVLEQGEVTIHVRHDAANPFTVTSGRVTIQDVGTTFNISRLGNRLAIEVSEGAVLFQPMHERVTLMVGDVLTARSDGTEIVRTKLSPKLMGGWRTGTLTFKNEPLGNVLAIVHRQHDVVLEDNLSQRPFTGMVRLTGSADRDIPHLAALIGAKWRRDGERWILSANGTAPGN